MRWRPHREAPVEAWLRERVLVRALVVPLRAMIDLQGVLGLFHANDVPVELSRVLEALSLHSPFQRRACTGVWSRYKNWYGHFLMAPIAAKLSSSSIASSIPMTPSGKGAGEVLKAK